MLQYVCGMSNNKNGNAVSTSHIAARRFVDTRNEEQEEEQLQK